MKNLVLLERGVSGWSRNPTQLATGSPCIFRWTCLSSSQAFIPVRASACAFTHKQDDWQQMRDLRCCFLCLAGHQPPCLWVLPAGFPQLPLCCLPVEVLRKGLLHITLALISALECRLPSPHVQYGACKVWVEWFVPLHAKRSTHKEAGRC